MNRRGFYRRVSLGAALGAVVGVGVFLYSRYVEPYWVAVERVTLPLPRLAPPFDGYRIVHIGDFHLDGWMTPERLERVVDLVNQQEPDLVAITGDFVAVSVDYISGLPGPLGKLRATDGVVAVLGNPHYMNDADAVRRGLSSTGVVDVSNGVYTLRRDGAALHLCGVDSVMEGYDRLEEVLEALDEAEPGCAVLLAHEPDFADKTAATGRFDLQLSGHSHGGQVRIPLLGRAVLPPFSQRYTRGLHGGGGMLVYTNRGLGTV